MNFEKIAIKKIVNETNDTKTFFFSIPIQLSEKFSYKPGQYLTLKANINGEEVRRAYSISTAPSEATIGVSIKKLTSGRMSNFAHNTWKEGDLIDVAAPDGNFIVEADHDKKRSHFFVAAGSGITPIMSMIKTILEEEPMSICYLLYGSRDEQSIIFKNELASLESKYADQLFIMHTLSKPIVEKEGGLFGAFKKGKTTWIGETGRISPAKIEVFFDKYSTLNKYEQQFYLCGPGEVIQSAQAELEKRGINKKQIHKEYFSTAASNGGAVSNGSSKIKVHLNGEIIEYTSDGKKPILDELIAMKKNPPYSCTSGACSSCMAKVLNGKVEMDVCYALDDADLDKGLILTCQAKSSTPDLELTYDI
jgi:ring-1,2-phenylacetyl-CoA epoxidase subunit PaaE